MGWGIEVGVGEGLIGEGYLSWVLYQLSQNLVA